MKEALYNLNFKQLTEVQKIIDNIINENIDNFFLAINQNKIEQLQPIIDFGLAEDNLKFIQLWHSFKITSSTSIETLNYLDQVLKNGYPKLHSTFIHKFKTMLEELFIYSSDKKEKKFLNATDDSLTDYLEWTIEKYPSVLDNDLKKTVLSSWGKIRFNPQKHSKIESFVLNEVKVTHSYLLTASRLLDKEHLKHFFNNNYMKSLHISTLPEEFFSQCLFKAISARNLSGVEFWIEKKAPLPKEKGCFIELITNTADNTEILEKIINYAGTALFNDQVLLDNAILLNRQQYVKFLLENFYNTLEDIEESRKIVDNKINNSNKSASYNKKKNESMTFLKEYIKYKSLELKLDKKEEPINNKFKI